MWNDADNDGMRGTKGADGAWTGLAEGEELLPGVQLTLERYYQVVGDPQATWTYDPTWAVNDGAYQADPTVGLLGDNHYGATPAPVPAPDDADNPDAPATREGEDEGDAGDKPEQPAAATHNTVTDENGAYRFDNLKTQGWLDVPVAAAPDAEGEGPAAKADEPAATERKRVVFGYKVRVTDSDWWNRYWGTAKYLQGDSYALASEDWAADSDLIHEDGYLMARAEDGTPEEVTVLLDVATGSSPTVNDAVVADRKSVV